jgi:ATP-binding cassette subfamily B protein RaxB
MLYAFIAYKNQFKDRLAALVDYLIEYRLLGVHLDRISDIALTPAEHLEPRSALPAVNAESSLLKVAELAFTYPDRAPLFSGISLQLEQGESLAIGGPSGCGKSTLLRLIAGLTPLQSGEVQLAGFTLRNCPLGIWRSQIAFVSQEDGIISGSLADNITLFDDTPNDNRLNMVGDLVGLGAMVEQLPLRWETRLGELGIALSAGQQQRVLLARALYSDPTLLILDEATAHLDEAAEANFFQQLKRLNLSCLVVSHRASVHAFAHQSIQLGENSNVELTRQDNHAQ